MKIYGFFYNDCIHESAPGLMSLHKSEKNAEIAMEFHKEKERKIFKDHENYWDEKKVPDYLRYTFGNNKQWFVEKLKVEE